MQMSLGNMVVHLSDGKVLAFRDARNVHLECNEGMVWLTVEGHQSDIVLAKGERQRIESDGLAILQGMPSASVKLARRAMRPNLQEFRSSADQVLIERRVRNEIHRRNISSRLLNVFSQLFDRRNPELGGEIR